MKIIINSAKRTLCNRFQFAPRDTFLPSILLNTSGRFQHLDTTCSRLNQLGLGMSALEVLPDRFDRGLHSMACSPQYADSYSGQYCTILIELLSSVMRNSMLVKNPYYMTTRLVDNPCIFTSRLVSNQFILGARFVIKTFYLDLTLGHYRIFHDHTLSSENPYISTSRLFNNRCILISCLVDNQYIMVTSLEVVNIVL